MLDHQLGDRRIGAVLFDMDGTLVDTEPYWIAAEFDLVTRHGGTWTHEHAHALVGSDLLVAAAYIREHGGVDLEPAAIVQALLDEVIVSCQRALPWRPGARELLVAVRELGIPCGMVTMSYGRLAHAVADALPAGSFATVVAGDDVTHGKPHPEPYLTAAARLGVDPASCVAIEDSPTGLLSAASAGCAVLGVACQVPLSPDPRWTLRTSLATTTVQDLSDLVD